MHYCGKLAISRTFYRTQNDLTFVHLPPYDIIGSCFRVSSKQVVSPTLKPSKPSSFTIETHRWLSKESSLQSSFGSGPISYSLKHHRTDLFDGIRRHWCGRPNSHLPTECNVKFIDRMFPSGLLYSACINLKKSMFNDFSKPALKVKPSFARRLSLLKPSPSNQKKEKSLAMQVLLVYLPCSWVSEPSPSNN